LAGFETTLLALLYVCSGMYWLILVYMGMIHILLLIHKVYAHICSCIRFVCIKVPRYVRKLTTSPSLRHTCTQTSHTQTCSNTPARPPARRFRHRHRLGLGNLLHRRDWGRGQVLGLQRQRAAGHRQHLKRVESCRRARCLILSIEHLLTCLHTGACFGM
jgi:hypothetical protein